MMKVEHDLEIDLDSEIEIVPTVMPDSFDDFIEKIERVAPFVKTIQIDVMDGKFVPSTSWPYSGENFGISDQNWQNLINQSKGIPHWQKINFEVDLMVKDQIKESQNWVSAGVGRAIFHIEALKEQELELGEKEVMTEILKIKEQGIDLSFALVPETPNSELEKYLDIAESVQFMGINKIGYQGQEFAPAVLDKISELHSKRHNLPISVDGGVSFKTAKKLVHAGATRLASGSVIFKAANTERVIKDLFKTANS